MKRNIAFIGIIVENIDNVPKLNSLLSEYGESIIGRMGIPYHDEKINIITIVLDAEPKTIDILFEKIKKVEGMYANIIKNN